AARSAASGVGTGALVDGQLRGAGRLLPQGRQIPTPNNQRPNTNGTWESLGFGGWKLGFGISSSPPIIPDQRLSSLKPAVIQVAVPNSSGYGSIRRSAPTNSSTAPPLP